MKIFHTRKHLLAFFMPGFLFGVIYVNLIAKNYVAEPGIFSDYFLSQYQTVKIKAEEYIWYLIRLRAVPFLALLGFSFTKARKIAAVLFLVWTGISGRHSDLYSRDQHGNPGKLSVHCGHFPTVHFLYTAYLILIWYCWSYPQNRWNRQKTVFVSLAVSTGMLLEIYVNPSLVRAFLSTL